MEVKYHPQITATIAFLKKGLTIAGKKQTGNIFLIDIGVPKSVLHKFMESNEIPKLEKIYQEFTKKPYIELT
jgi:hypothetical protein